MASPNEMFRIDLNGDKSHLSPHPKVLFILYFTVLVRKEEQ
jgi:hypothetical protein